MRMRSCRQLWGTGSWTSLFVGGGSLAWLEGCGTREEVSKKALGTMAEAEVGSQVEVGSQGELGSWGEC